MNTEELTSALASEDSDAVSNALDTLYGTDRELPPAPSRFTARKLLTGIVPLMLLAGAIAVFSVRRNAVAAERRNIQQATAELPCFFAAVEDDSDRNLALASTLTNFQVPQYSQNKPIWAEAALRVYALLAIQSTKEGNWEQALRYERQARGLLPDVGENRQMAACIISYVRCRHRHEKAMSESPRDHVALAANVVELRSFLENTVAPEQAVEETVAYARLHSLLGISCYKVGEADNSTFARCRELLDSVPVSERAEEWYTAFARQAADRSLWLTSLEKFSEASDCLAEAIAVYAPRSGYLRGLLHANRADSIRVQRKRDAGSSELADLEIQDRIAAHEAFSRESPGAQSENHRDNRLLNLARLAFLYGTVGRWGDARNRVREIENSVDDLISFPNSQIGKPYRVWLSWIAATDPERSELERSIYFLRGLQHLHAFRESRPDYDILEQFPAILPQLSQQQRTVVEKAQGSAVQNN